MVGPAPAGLELGWRWFQRGHVPRSWLSHRHELSSPLPSQPPRAVLPRCCFLSKAGLLVPHVLWFGALPVRVADYQAAWEQSKGCVGRGALCEGPSSPNAFQHPGLEGPTPVPHADPQHPLKGPPPERAKIIKWAPWSSFSACRPGAPDGQFQKLPLSRWPTAGLPEQLPDVAGGAAGWLGQAEVTASGQS